MSANRARETDSAFQDQIPHNHCWGCGPLNDHGLHVRSHWSGDRSVCTWQPAPWHAAGPRHVLNGGIIATVIDCHCVCTAIAAAYRVEDRRFESEPLIWYATASLNVDYLRPTPLHQPLQLSAWIDSVEGKRTTVRCSLTSGGKECARGQIVAVRVPESWRQEPANI